MGWIVIDCAVNRGGNWDNGVNAGVFYANLNNAPSNSNTNNGFRCSKSFKVRFISLRRAWTIQWNYINSNPDQTVEYQNKNPTVSRMKQFKNKFFIYLFCKRNVDW